MAKAAEKKNLVIVESPAKAKTIEKILGKTYQVVASFGHVRDLPKSKLGVDIENNFTPSYSTIKGKGDVIKNLKALAKKSDKVYLASDPDREGEAIAWHIAHALKLDENDNNRIEFNEITEHAIKDSITHPRKIDMNKVNAQQARRILDRLVGYGISSLLWKSVASNTSAGRVQSVALKLICDLEHEIKKFVPVKFWEVKGDFTNDLKLSLYRVENKKIDRLTDEDIVKEIKKIEKKEFTIVEAKVTKKTKNSPLPLKTSTLQQLASSYLGFSASKTMRIAQGLYEGIDVNGVHKGLITYMRTDSTRISEDAQEMAKNYILENFGKEYLGVKKESKSKQKIQDAHEAIRPTDVTRTPAMLKDSLSRDQFRLYQLIWKRFVASRMMPAVYETTSVKIAAGKYRFNVATSKIAFEGFRLIYTEAGEEKDEKGVLLKGLDENSELSLKQFDSKQHFTQPPAHYTEASLVKTLEELGIGRPSTYAPTITLIINRRYVAKENKNLYMTELGEVVNNIMMHSFPSIVDVSFT
uniref:type I DNA topoisomerase n=1 Tax=uncultured Fusobacterium sp. TaxID=159267 RepID=UPI0025E24E58